jgi:transcriptional regulator with XRE-family HTH domain
MNHFGTRIKQIREQKGIVQRLIANQLCIDTPMLSKIEMGRRNAKRLHVTLFSQIFKVPEDELLSLWLADKVYELVKDETVALKAIQVVEKDVKKIKRNNIK